MRLKSLSSLLLSHSMTQEVPCSRVCFLQQLPVLGGGSVQDLIAVPSDLPQLSRALSFFAQVLVFHTELSAKPCTSGGEIHHCYHASRIWRDLRERIVCC